MSEKMHQSEDIMKHASQKPKIYCLSMWKSVHVDVDGYLTPCCMFIHGADKKTRIEDIEEGKTIEHVLLDEFQEYRDMLSEGKWPRGCNQCEFAEKEGRSSKRLQDMGWNNMRNHDGNLAYLTEPTNVALEYLQLKTGRLCNLECTICTPTCSTKIATRHYKQGKIDKETYDKLQAEIQWATNLDQLKKMNSQYYRIDIAGGEPLMNKEHFQWLKQLPQESKAKTQLLYNTNGTQTPTDEEIEIWKDFKGVWITFSIDSAYKKFEKLRVNAKWDQVIENMRYVTNEVVRNKLHHQTSNGYTNTAIVMTVHAGNVTDMMDLYDATKHLKWVQRDYINYNYLYYPESMAIHNMSKDNLKKAIDYYNDNIERLPRGKMYDEAINIRKSMEGFLEKRYEDEHRKIGIDAREEINLEDITFMDKT